MRIRVETSSGMPITRQIAAQIRAQCASESLKPGDRLPSVRALAAELAVNQNTILRVYERLTARPTKLYGADLGSNYQAQGLKLSKHFRISAFTDARAAAGPRGTGNA